MDNRLMQPRHGYSYESECYFDSHVKVITKKFHHATAGEMLIEFHTECCEEKQRVTRVLTVVVIVSTHYSCM